MKSIQGSFIGVQMFAASAILAASCSQTPTVNDLPPLTAECRTTVRIAIVIDESTSMSSSGTAPVKAEELRPLIDTLANCGGALGVGFVREAPQPGMERIEFPQPPLLPAAPRMQVDEQGYEFDDRVAAFNQLRLDRENSVKGALEKKKPDIDEFFRKMNDLLSRPAAKGTDLNSALNAADLFLSEPMREPGWNATLIIVSDGIDTRHRPRRPFSSGARVIWVNTTSEDKVLPGYGARRVEALSAAVTDVIDNSQVRRAE